MNQAEIQNKFKLLELRDIQDLIEPRAILTNIISVFPSAKHVPYFATRKTANYISIQLRKAVQASFARTGGSSLASESCTIRKSWKKIQLPFITCNSANHERHFHNNGQAHTLILTYHLQVSANVASTHTIKATTYMSILLRRHPNSILEEPRALDSRYIQTYVYYKG